MVVLRVVALVLGAGLRNRLRAQLRRLRSPRYAIAFAIGLLYWWWYFGRVLLGGVDRPTLSAEALPLAELVVVGLGLLAVALSWLFGSDRSAIAFSEAEIQHLFPAPLGRRALLHYKLLSSLATTLLGAGITALVLGRSVSSSRVLFALGSWIAFATLAFHRTAAALTHVALREHGVAGLRRRALTLGGVALAVAALAVAAGRVPGPGPFVPEVGWLAAWAEAVRGSLLGALLWPVRASVRLALAPDLGSFLLALPGALLVLGLHYAWVMSSSIQLEEAAVEASRARAQALERVRASGHGLDVVRAKGKRRPPFRLAPRGRPETAFLWKGLIAGGRLLALRVLVVTLVFTAATLAATVAWQLDAAAEAGGVFAIALWGGAILVGPTVVRFDLRTDLPNLEILRALPVRGAALVRGAIFAPAAVLAAVQTLLVLVAAVALGPILDGRLAPGDRLGLALAAAVVGPVVTLVSLTVQNAFAVLFPAWMPGPNAPRGPEAIGLGILSMLASLLAWSIALLPAAGLGGVAAALAAPLGLGPAALAAAAVAAAVVAGEFLLATAALGRAFDRIDVGQA